VPFLFPIPLSYYLLVYRLGDRDDDVRSVAASCLIPVATHLVRQLPSCLTLVLSVLWACLGDMKDDLGSSVGAVMDLLGCHFLLSRKAQILMTYREACLV